MRKSPRLLAGVVALGLFAVVGTLTAGAFSTNSPRATAPQGNTETRADVKVSAFEETRGGSTIKP